MNGDTPISEHALYNQAMKKSLIDKIYFMDKVDADVFIDIGCADGVLVKFLARNFNQHEYIGYDNDPEMIKLACEGYSWPDEQNVAFVSSQDLLNMMVVEAKNKGKRICVILSSMIHEVYSYSRDVSKFFDIVFKDISPDCVAIRDMAVSDTASRLSDSISVARVRQVFDSRKISKWESQWGSIDENWSLTHFLLTYRYERNWERELKENYLPITKESLLKLIPLEYMPILIEHYTLPYLRREVKKDFGIELQERTHLKLILER